MAHSRDNDIGYADGVRATIVILEQRVEDHRFWHGSLRAEMRRFIAAAKIIVALMDEKNGR